MAYFTATRSAWAASSQAGSQDKARHASRRLWLYVGIIALAGAALRIVCARGDLWLDEIWSYRLLDIQSSVTGILFALPHDNNHVLNTLWLSAVGPQAAPILVRLPAILFGTLSIPAAARFGARRNPTFALAAAAVFAFGPFFVHYGSEARGYAGLILAALLAVDAAEVCLEHGTTAARLIAFAAAVAFGTFSHLLMVEITGVLWFATVIRLAWRQGMTADVARLAGSLALAAATGAVPPVACFVYAALNHGVWTGVVHPYSLHALGYGLARAVGAIFALPDTAGVLAWSSVTVAAAALCTCAAMATLPRERAVFYAPPIFALPALAALLHMTYVVFARFHMFTVIALALLAAEVWAAGWRRGGVRRTVAIAAAAAFAAGSALHMLWFVGPQRGHYADAVAFMARDGAATYRAEPAPLSGVTDAVIRWYDPTHRLARADAAASPCTQPDWLVVAVDPNEFTGAPPSRTPGEGCPAYVVRATFPAYGLSGFVWLLYGAP